MGRPPSKATEVRSRMLHVRLREAEYAGLQELAGALGQTPSRVLRRLIREALTGGPDYFKDELVDLRGLVRELTANGRNLNQLARAADVARLLASPGARLPRLTPGRKKFLGPENANMGQRPASPPFRPARGKTGLHIRL